MRQNLIPALKECTLPNEGGWNDHEPASVGGYSMRGVTLMVYRAWRARNNEPQPSPDDLKAITEDEAVAIYTVQYAKAIRFDDLPAGVDAALLDFAVNLGPTGAVKLLQSCVGVAENGHLDLVTTEAVKEVDAVQLANRLCDGFLDLKRERDDWPRYAKGYTKRANATRAYALALAAKAAA